VEWLTNLMKYPEKKKENAQTRAGLVLNHQLSRTTLQFGKFEMVQHSFIAEW
jgi:hypothetical protein